MKKLLFLFIIVLLTSCNVPTFYTDPSVKESERNAVLEKAKIDTLIIVIEMDDYVYHVKDNKIIQKVEKQSNAYLILFLLGILVCLAIMGIILSR